MAEEFKILITGDATGIIDASRKSEEALDKVGQKTEEGGKSADHAGISHHGLHLIFRQVGEASKSLEIGMMALTGVMTGSLMFGVYAVIAAVKALAEHFQKQKEVALEAAKATVQFWTDALQGNADARKAAADYADALQKIINNVDTLKEKESQEEAVLRRVAEQRLKILDAQRQAEIAAAKGDKEEEARINARYGQRKTDIELQNEEAEINLKKQHLDEQTRNAYRWQQVADDVEEAKKGGAPGREEASAAEQRSAKLNGEMAKLQAARMDPKDLAELRKEVARRAGEPSSGVSGAISTAGVKRDQLYRAEVAEEAYGAAQQEYEQAQADIERFKTGTAKLAKAVEEALQELGKAAAAARATGAEIGKDEAAHKVNVDAGNVIRQIKAGEIIQAGGAPDNPLSRSVVSDIQAMEALGGGQRMDAKQTEMINHLVAGLRAQGTSQATINGLLSEMKDMHVDAATKFKDIWAELRQVHKQMKNNAAP